MTSAAASPPADTSAYRAARRGRRPTAFAAVLLVFTGFFNVTYGVAAIGGSNVFAASTHQLIAGLRAWGWITVVLGIVQLLTFGGVRAGNQLARWFAVTVIALSIIDQLLSVPAYPFWSLTVAALDVVALYGLCAEAPA